MNCTVQVRDLMNWASGLRTAMSTEEKVRDAASAQTLKAEHEAVKAEIEAREENFRLVMELGETMVQGDHYASQVRLSCFVFSLLYKNVKVSVDIVLQKVLEKDISTNIKVKRIVKKSLDYQSCYHPPCGIELDF